MARLFEPGEAIAGYVLERRLGGGGFGSVWRASDTQGNPVAMKLLNVDRHNLPATVRLRAEIELLAAAASQQSAHVVQVLDGGADPVPFVVMELIDGPSLADELEERGALPQAEVIAIARGVANALHALEAVGVIHRDVKPANVMLDSAGTVKLTDFGIAKITGYATVTASGQLPLSAAYAAPEVWAGEATNQSDLYALGAMLFECLAGRRPFVGSFVELYRLHLDSPAPLELLPANTVPALRGLIAACLEKSPGRRPEGAIAVVALAEAAARQLVAGTATALTEPVGREPCSLGPWSIVSRETGRPWQFACEHELTGEPTTVSVHFAATLAEGEALRQQVQGDPFVRGMNRLILRPGESWPTECPRGFPYWVARGSSPAERPELATTVVPSARVARQTAAGGARRLMRGVVHPSVVALVSGASVLLALTSVALAALALS